MSRKNQENVLIIVVGVGVVCVGVGVGVGVVRVGVVVDINGVDKMTLFSILGGCQNFVVARFRSFSVLSVPLRIFLHLRLCQT